MPASFAKPLSALLKDLREYRLHGEGDPEIRSIEFDSRHVKSGSLFVALRGLKDDGARFIGDAVLRGASAIASESSPTLDGRLPFVQVPNARKALAELAWTFYDHPERTLVLTAVTGTNGKTTVATQLRDVLEFAGRRAGLVGTIGVYYGSTAEESTRTTPESVDLAAHFSAMHAKGLTHAVMEATSIGVDLERTWGIPFKVAVFTNLTRDHLDYHHTEQAYREAKLRLFRDQSSECVSVINADDPSCEYFVKASPGPVLTYGIEKDADYQARNLMLLRDSLRFDLTARGAETSVQAPLIGRFNVYNLLAVIAAAHAQGIQLESIRSALRQAKPVRGRAEIVPSSAPFTVVVDYAHTPDALEQILTSLGGLEHRRILTVIGAGGDRDKGKRPQMAEAASRLSNVLFLTSDNPRSENPEAILDDMAAGVPAGRSFHRDTDRRLTIERALSEAQTGDIVLIAGKGHETYQEIAGVKHPFDDRAVALQWLARAGYGS
jgi:UDP-N-acetylmuramoyl-L-alanyl-D-glutamate--2,6-diaminopimelate ligase